MGYICMLRDSLGKSRIRWAEASTASCVQARTWLKWEVSGTDRLVFGRVIAAYLG